MKKYFEFTEKTLHYPINLFFNTSINNIIPNEDYEIINFMIKQIFENDLKKCDFIVQGSSYSIGIRYNKLVDSAPRVMYNNVKIDNDILKNIFGFSDYEIINDDKLAINIFLEIKLYNIVTEKYFERIIYIFKNIIFNKKGYIC